MNALEATIAGNSYSNFLGDVKKHHTHSFGTNMPLVQCGHYKCEYTWWPSDHQQQGGEHHTRQAREKHTKPALLRLPGHVCGALLGEAAHMSLPPAVLSAMRRISHAASDQAGTSDGRKGHNETSRCHQKRSVDSERPQANSGFLEI